MYVICTPTTQKLPTMRTTKYMMLLVLPLVMIFLPTYRKVDRDLQFFPVLADICNSVLDSLVVAKFAVVELW